MSKKATIITSETGAYIVKSGFDFVAWRATKCGQLTLQAMQAYSDARAEKGMIDSVVADTVKKYRLEASAKKADIRAEKAHSIANGADKEQANKIADEAIDSINDYTNTIVDAIANAKNEVKRAVTLSISWKNGIKCLISYLKAHGHSAETFTEVVKTYTFSALGISFKDETIKVIVNYLLGIDTKKASDKDYYENQHTLIEQSDSYIVTALINLICDTLERANMISVGCFNFEYKVDVTTDTDTDTVTATIEKVVTQ